MKCYDIIHICYSPSSVAAHRYNVFATSTTWRARSHQDVTATMCLCQYRLRICPRTLYEPAGNTSARDCRQRWSSQVAKVIWQRPHRICGGNQDTHLTFLGSPRAFTPNRTSIHSALFAQQSHMTDRDRRPCHRIIDRNSPHFMYLIRAKNELIQCHQPFCLPNRALCRQLRSTFWPPRAPASHTYV